MLYRWRDQFNRWQFGRRVHFLARTPPITLSGTGPLLLSQLQHKDVQMYLAAIKSFARHLPPAEVHLVDDGSLTTADRAMIALHVPEVMFHDLPDWRKPGLPAGGTWERLTAIAQLSESRYVIQLDADTLTIGPIPEVAAAIRENRAFTIGTWDGQTIESVCERAQQTRLRNATSQHVQMQAERHLDQLGNANTLNYIRGCSGFAGFSPGPGKIDFMREVSAQMSRMIGNAWNQWGSEQFMSNLLVANQHNAMVLPHPDYSDCEHIKPSTTRFIHFIGTCRFRDGHYADMIHKLNWEE